MAKIECSGLTEGLTLNLNGARIDTSATTDSALIVDAEGDGDNDVKVMGSIIINSAGEEGLRMVRDGAGLLGLDLKKGSTITFSDDYKAIFLSHKGKAGKTEGINIVSSAVIDVSGSTAESKTGIWAQTDNAVEGAIIPISIHLTGGSISAEDSAENAYERGHGVVANQAAEGDITITVEPGVNIGANGKFLGAIGIHATMRPVGEGNITIRHLGEIYATHGIRVSMITPSAKDQKRGDIEIETGANSKIVTQALGATPKLTNDRSGTYPYGILAHINGEARIGKIKITHKGMIDAAGIGIETSGNRDVTVTLEKGSSITAKEKGIEASSSGGGTVTITHGGTIKAAGEGIYAYGGTGVPKDITVTLEKGSSITSTGNDGVYAAISSSAGKGDIKINHYGKIVADGNGVFIGNFGTGSVEVMTEANSSITASGAGTYKSGINASVRESSVEGAVRINHKGTITADHEGIYATNRVSTGTGAIMITAVKGSTITAKRQGIRVRHDGTGKFDVQIRGTVVGDSEYTSGTEYAGVHVQGRTGGDATKVRGGTIRIGPWGHVSSKPKDKPVDTKIAIQVDAYAGTDAHPVTIILEEDEAGVVGHVEGRILKPVKGSEDDTRSTLKFQTRNVSGADMELKVNDAVYRRGKRVGVYDQVIKAQLTELADKEGYWFKDDDTPGDLRLYSHRARLYEVVPSVLLGLVDLTPYSTRMAVPRRSTGDEEIMVQSSKGEHVAVPGSRTGVWVRLAVRDGERMADTSTTARDVWRQSLAWDVKQTDFEAGLEVPTDDHLVLGVSAHYRQSEATVKRGGTMEANGTGVGVSLTWTDDSGLYVDGQLSYTRFFDIAMTSSRQGVITSKGGGSGLALGVEVGQPMSIGGMAVTPRGGLSWSSVDMDAFDEPTTIDGAGRVTPDKEQSVQGRVGVLAELGPEDADRRLYASLDLEHEFSSRHAVMVAGARLETEMKPTWVRLGVGGAMFLGGHDTTQLTGDAFYATAGSDNTDFGGGLAVTFRF